MFASSKFFSTILIAILYTTAITVNAAPWPLHKKHATHRVRHIGRNVQVESYHPKTTFKTYGAGLEQPGAPSPIATSIQDSAVNFLTTQQGYDANSIGYRSGFNTTNGRHAYVTQSYQGVPFANAVANIAWKDGKVVSFGSSFIQPTSIAPSTPSIPFDSVVSATEDALGAKFNGQTPAVEYLARQDGSAALTHVFQLRNEDQSTWYEAYVDAHTGELLSVTDFVAHASYTVVPISKISVDDGIETLTDPENLNSSPFGWQFDGQTNSTTTSGNNALAAKDDTAGVTSQSSPGFNFNYAYDDSQDPTVQTNVEASTVNAFFIANTIHDVAYQYGFTEDTFNFQSSNFGNGGEEGDPVLVSIQDASGTNNANFATPPDGQSGICRMFVWDLTNPRKDGAMENDIIVHEMAHGITNRMTGGGTGRCLQTTEAGGMGEGWSDAVAEWVQQTDGQVRDFVLGTYVTEIAAGIRTFPYSTDFNVNPLMFSDVGKLNEVHNIGEVWATMLHGVYAGLVGANGFSTTFLTDASGTEGNVVFMQLLMDALLLQPCNPTFVDARNAWIQADVNRYNGVHQCTLWNAFASRGLGLNAQEDFVDDTTVPPECAGTGTGNGGGNGGNGTGAGNGGGAGTGAGNGNGAGTGAGTGIGAGNGADDNTPTEGVSRSSRNGGRGRGRGGNNGSAFGGNIFGLRGFW